MENEDKVEEIKVEEQKVQEVKVEDPKVEEIKKEEVKDEEPKKDEKAKKPKVLWIVLGVLLLITLILSISLFVTGDDEPVDDSYKDRNDNVQEENKNENNEHDKETGFVIFDGSVLFHANNSFYEEGKKEFLIRVDAWMSEIYDNKLYYSSNPDILGVYDTIDAKLGVYDIISGQTKEYDFSNVKFHENTVIIPGKKYVVVSDGKNNAVINLENNTFYNFATNSSRGNGLIDDKNNMFYYCDNGLIYGLDLVTNNKIQINGVSGYPFYQDNNNIYIYGEDGYGNDVFYSFAKGTTDVKKLNIVDYNSAVSRIPNLGIIGKDLYITFGNEDKLVKYNITNDMASYILEKDYIKFYIIENKLYIASDLIPSEVEDAESVEFNSFYVYDSSTDSLTTLENTYIKELFKSDCIIYNMK